MTIVRTLALILVSCSLVTLAVADDGWPQFRGPGGQGNASSSAIPLTWDLEQHLSWSANVPGKGYSSPIIQGNRVWVTTAVEFEPTPEQKRQSLEASRLEPKDFARRQVAGRVSLRILCFDYSTGERIYETVVAEVESPEAIHVGNSYASPTPVIVGNRVYAHFGVNGTACLDAETGDVLWRRSIPVFYSVGAGSSPVVYGELLILVCDGIDKQFVIALDRNTGQTVWKADRPPKRAEDGQLQKAYSTPLVIHHEGQDQLIVPGAQWVVSYNPATGEEIWRVDHGDGFSTIPRPVYGNGLVYICTGYSQSQLLAIRVGGKGDVTSSHVVWKAQRQISRNPSPLLADELLFVISDNGICTCFDALTGTTHWQQRIAGNYSASPVLANGHVFVLSHEGTITAIPASRHQETLTTSHAPGELKASPAIVKSSVILRSGSQLYRIN
ncbi:MAG: PQQ-binding-like beta-propeller repeat protein [Planctomycetota bacterium]|nr:PQQ-binding-like beta-propeller repeat protein [Planctomycetota bacterium]MDA1165364.1 PQQ-binding-like beta-propeller repeat protein [Planctomycetota bacterium]